MSGYLYQELSHQVIGLAMKVHRTLLNGMPEQVYRRSLCHDLRKEGIPLEAEKRFQVTYDGELVGTFRVDLIVDGKILLELKAVEQLIDQHRSQILSYLKASGIQVGLLINFGAKSLQFERFVN